MMDDPKKLVRGLKDISPLFGAVAEEVPFRRSPEVQILGVSSPDCEGDSLLLNTLFASKIASPGRSCSLVSVLSRRIKASSGAGEGPSEPFGNHIERYSLYWDELHELVDGPHAARPDRKLRDRDVFLDFEYRHLLHFERVITLLDKWVLVLKPTAESLTEGYKMMKVGLAINPQLEFYITLSGSADEGRGAMIFERFSNFVLTHLDAYLGWLGWMDLEDPTSHFSAALHTGSLKYQHWNVKPTLQKYLLANWIESLEKRTKVCAPAEVLR